MLGQINQIIKRINKLKLIISKFEYLKDYNLNEKNNIINFFLPSTFHIYNKLSNDEYNKRKLNFHFDLKIEYPLYLFQLRV